MIDFEKVFEGWWDKDLPVSEETISIFQERISHTLPKDYLDFLRWSNGGEGDTGEMYFAFGNDGSSFLVFDKNNNICRTPFGSPFDDMIEELAPNFMRFLEKLKL